MNEEHVVLKIEKYNDFLKQKEKFEKEIKDLKLKENVLNILAGYYDYAKSFNQHSTAMEFISEKEIMIRLEKQYNIQIAKKQENNAIQFNITIL